MARPGRRRRGRSLLPQHRLPRPGARAVPGDPRRRREGEPASPDRGRPGGRPGGALPEPPLHGIPSRPRLLPLRPPRRGIGGNAGRSRRRGVAVRRRGHRLRPRPGRGHEPAQPGDRGPGVFRRPGGGGDPRGGVRRRADVAGDPPGGETFPRARRHRRRLPRGASRRPDGKKDPPRAGAGSVPPRGPRGDPGHHERPRGVHGARPFPPCDAFPKHPERPASGEDAVPGDGLFRRAGDEGDLRAPRHGRGGGARRRGGMRRGAGVPGGGSPGGGDRADRPGGPGRRYFPAGAVGGGPAFGTASGVGGVEGTLSAEPGVGWIGAASGAIGAAAGAVGRYRASIPGR